MWWRMELKTCEKQSSASEQNWLIVLRLVEQIQRKLSPRTDVTEG